MDIIAQEIDFYKRNRKDFINLYNGKYLVIKGMEIVGIYKTHSEAYSEAVRQHEKGTFIIEHPVALKFS